MSTADSVDGGIGLVYEGFDCDEGAKCTVNGVEIGMKRVLEEKPEIIQKAFRNWISTDDFDEEIDALLADAAETGELAQPVRMVSEFDGGEVEIYYTAIFTPTLVEKVGDNR
jgi:hypothetical protein